MVRLRSDRFQRACHARGWTTVSEQARQLGIARVTLHRVLAGTQTPTLDTVSLILVKLRLEFDDLFEAA